MTCFWTANSTNDMFLDYKFIEDRFASDMLITNRFVANPLVAENRGGIDK